MSEKGRGFSGFGSMVSDLSDLPPIIEKTPINTPKAPPVAPRPQNSDAKTPTSSNNSLAPPKSKSTNPLAVFVIIVVALMGLVAITTDKKPLSPSATSTLGPNLTPAPSQAARSVAIPRAPAQAKTEDMPSPNTNIGNGLDPTFSDSQIRYCLAQNIRLQGAYKVLDKMSQPSIDDYNARINDYNSRCERFRYRRGTLEAIRTEVEGHRADLEAEGARLVNSMPTAATPPPPTWAR